MRKGFTLIGLPFPWIQKNNAFIHLFLTFRLSVDCKLVKEKVLSKGSKGR